MFTIVERLDDGRQIAIRVNMIEFITRHTDVDGVDYFSMWLQGQEEGLNITFDSGVQIYNPLGMMEATQDEEVGSDDDDN